MTYCISTLSDFRSPRTNGAVASSRPNHSLEAEQNVLGALMLDGSLLKKLPPALECGDFFNTAHNLIFDAIVELVSEGKSCDPVNVAQYLEAGEEGDPEILQRVGGFAYLSQLARETIITGEKACEYALEILKLSVKRCIYSGVTDQSPHGDLLEGIAYELDRLKAAPVAEEKRVVAAPIDWSKLEGYPPERIWWAPDWVRPDPMVISGAGGIGKSRLWQAIATSLATGREYLWPVLKPLRLLIWNCEEDHDEIWRVQADINRHLRVDMEDLTGLHIVPRRGLDNTLLELVYGKPMVTPTYTQDLYQQVNDLKVDVLVLDNIAQVYGCNENDRHQATLFVNTIAGLVRDRPFCPVLLGHVARSPGSEFSGSAAWENAVRMRWYLGATLPDQEPEEDEPVDTGVVYLCRRKANYTDKDWMRLRFHNGLLVPDQPEGRRFDQGYRDDHAEEVVLASIPKLRMAGLLPSDSPQGADYLPKQIAAKGYAQGCSKKDLASAMHRLMGAGRLRREKVGTYSNRTPRMGLVIV